jgi:hypothetical protein
MLKHGKTVRIYLADGSPNGIRHAEIVNWTGQAIVCPRGRIGELSEWPESQRPGLYILLGEDPERPRPLAYIGEAENVFSRLKTHVVKRDFWDRVVFFTSKDDNLTKAHVKYLESRVIELAHATERIALDNSTKPPRPALPRADRDAMEEFLDPTRILLGALGFSLLEPIRSHTEKQSGTGGPLAHIPLSWTMPKRGVQATGTATDEGFVVGQDSVGTVQVRASLSQGYAKLRADLIEQGAIVDDGNQIRFTRDVLFSSPSAAAAVLAGSSWNGRNEAWKDSNGKTLGALESALLSQD